MALTFPAIRPFDMLPRFSSEADLHACLVDNPDLIAQPGEVGRWHVVASEWILGYGVSGVPRGRVDVLMLCDDGLPAIVEAKIWSNDEIEGEVIAQVLRYRRGFLATARAASIRARSGAVLADAVWDSLDRHIADGNVRLVVVVDDAPIKLVLAASALFEAGLTVDLLEVRHDGAMPPQCRRVTLGEKLDRVGEWTDLATVNQPADNRGFPKKKDRNRGLLFERARLVPPPPSGMYRVVAAPFQTKQGKHPVDPQRGESSMAVMPDWLLLADTGNPYPRDIHAPTVVLSDENWRTWVFVGWCVWQILQERGEFSVADDAAKVEAMVDPEFPSFLHSRVWTEGKTFGLNALLVDLHCFGMADVMVYGNDYLAVPSEDLAHGIAVTLANRAVIAAGIRDALLSR